jgi:formate dehydrogenase assembly factor FdhD
MPFKQHRKIKGKAICGKCEKKMYYKGGNWYCPNGNPPRQKTFTSKQVEQIKQELNQAKQLLELHGIKFTKKEE